MAKWCLKTNLAWGKHVLLSSSLLSATIVIRHGLNGNSTPERGLALSLETSLHDCRVKPFVLLHGNSIRSHDLDLSEFRGCWLFSNLTTRHSVPETIPN